MKKIIVVRLENVLVKKFDLEKSFEMMVGRMEKKEKDVKGVIKGYEDDLGLDWKELRKRELMDRYEGEFERKEIYVEGKIQGVKVRVHNSSLFIERQDNASCSTSIIADILGIDSKRINDKQWLDGVWIIDLKELYDVL